MKIKNVLVVTLFACLLIIGAVSAADNNNQQNIKGDVNVDVSPNINVVNQNTNPVNVNVDSENNVNSPKTTTVTKITKIFATKKTYVSNVKIKRYNIVLKSDNQPVKKQLITLKIKGKKYKAKTNNNGKATFKITKLNKRGTYTGTITFAGNKNYKPISKKVKITIR